MSDQQNAYDRIIQSYAYGFDASSVPNYNNQGSSSDYNSHESKNNNFHDGGKNYSKPRDNRGGNEQRFNGPPKHNDYNSGSNDRYSNNNRNFSHEKSNSNEQFASNQSDTTIQRDTIFIQNLPKSVTVDELVTSFGSIGVIKIDKKTSQPKIWIYKDKNTGEGKGEATITYDDCYAATAAIEWFNEKEILGNIVQIQLATRKSNFNNPKFGKNNNRGNNFNNRDRNGGGGGGGSGFSDKNDRNYDRSRGYSNRSRPTPY